MALGSKQARLFILKSRNLLPRHDVLLMTVFSSSVYLIFREAFNFFFFFWCVIFRGSGRWNHHVSAIVSAMLFAKRLVGWTEWKFLYFIIFIFCLCQSNLKVKCDSLGWGLIKVFASILNLKIFFLAGRFKFWILYLKISTGSNPKMFIALKTGLRCSEIFLCPQRAKFYSVWCSGLFGEPSVCNSSSLF